MEEARSLDDEVAELDAFLHQPGWVDPSPLDDSNSPAWDDCLRGFGDVRPVQRGCWPYDCQRYDVTVMVDSDGQLTMPPVATFSEVCRDRFGGGPPAR